MSNKQVVAQDKAELERLEAMEAELAAENRADIDQADIQIPLLKVGHGNTVEVVDGDAAPGEFINSLTRTGIGREIEFIVAGFSKGRFDHGIRGEKRARKAYGNPTTVPWIDDPFQGRPFTEHPDAEESYSRRVNAGEIQWGKGPRISTTYDFTGFVVPEEGDVPVPVCLSLMRNNRKSAKNWLTLLDYFLRGKYWDAVFNLSTEQHRTDDGTWYTVNVKQGRKTEPHEKLAAVELAQALRHQTVEVVGEDDSATKAKPAETGGLGV